VTNMRVICVVVLVLLPWLVQAQPLPPDQACAAIVRTLDDATGHRDSNREAVRRGLIACRLFATSPAASADPLADVEPNPRGITRGEVEAAIADWCSTHMQAPLCQKLLRR
jgi:predicted exporter